MYDSLKLKVIEDLSLSLSSVREDTFQHFSLVCFVSTFPALVPSCISFWFSEMVGFFVFFFLSWGIVGVILISFANSCERSDDTRFPPTTLKVYEFIFE
jgi:hypothetical protein